MVVIEKHSYACVIYTEIKEEGDNKNEKQNNKKQFFLFTRDKLSYKLPYKISLKESLNSY